MKILALLPVLAVAGCAMSGPMTPGRTVYAMENGYAAALTAAVAYRHLPLCGPGSQTLCHTHVTVVRISEAGDKAYALMISAENITRAKGTPAQIAAAVAGAQAAITEFRSVIP